MFRRTTKRSFIPLGDQLPNNELTGLISTKNELVKVIEGYVKNRVPKTATLENLKLLKERIAEKITTLS